MHQSNGKASYAQGGFQTLHLLSGLGSHLSGLSVRLPPVSSLACTPPGFAPRPLRPHLTQWQYKVALTSHWNKVAWYSATIQKFQTETNDVIFLMAYTIQFEPYVESIKNIKKIMDHICTLWHEHLFVQRSVIIRHVYKTWSIYISLLPSFICDCTDTFIKTWKSIEIVKIWEGMSLTFGVAQPAGMLPSVLLV